jgi:diphthamide biosynthesis protein 7
LLICNRILLQTTLQPSAVLDLRFHPTEEGILAVASSTATLGIYQLESHSNAGAPLKELVVNQLDDVEAGTLFLQCQWHPTKKNWIGVTTSAGKAHLLVLGTDWAITRVVDLDLDSSLEPWSIAFSSLKQLADGSSCFSVYSGSDDSDLRYGSYTIVDESSEMTDNDENKPFIQLHSSKLARKHMAGVTAILPLSPMTPDGGRLVITGSYDDHIRLFSVQDLDQTAGIPMVKLLVEEHLGGGVWRLDLVRVEECASALKVLLLVSCMHAGARILEFSSLDGIAWNCAVLARFEEHKSMNYGSDFVRGDSRLLRCVSTSFYDRLLCVWEYERS